MTTISQPAPSGALATAWSRIWRARRLVERNIMVYRHQWIIIISGVFEPIFYLLGIGLGLGGIVREVPLPDGRVVSYAAYVAPALLATAAMNGAVFETIFNVFFKLNYAKTYDGVLATPMGITEIALGELLWALMRAALYAVAMFVIMLFAGLILSPTGILMVPAALLVAGAFAAAGLAGTAYLRSVNDFDVPMGLIVMPMFLFSGTFFPVSQLPGWLEPVAIATPLFHAVELVRKLALPQVAPPVVSTIPLWVHLAYLVVMTAAAWLLAIHFLRRRLKT